MINYIIRRIAVKMMGQGIASELYIKIRYRKPSSIFKSHSNPAKKKWLESKPRKELTWGLELNGSSFIKKMLNYKQFNYNTHILEVGPGLGRLLRSIIKKRIPFTSYVGLDSDKNNVEYLKETFTDPRIQFINGNDEEVIFDKKFDVMISSLKFKHFMPTFEIVLMNLSSYLYDNGLIFFDLDEISSKENDNSMEQYSKTRIIKIMEKCNLELVNFDEIIHVKGYKGTFVVGRKITNS